MSTPPPTCDLCDRLARARRGEHPGLIAVLPESTVFLADTQGCPGWCVLVLNDHAEHLDDLPLSRQERLFADVAAVARAIRAVHGPVRINYECLGNQSPHVHWHVIPRHANDPTPREAVWGWTREALRGQMPESDRRGQIEALRTTMTRSALSAPERN